jgi:hypothetical protein
MTSSGVIESLRGECAALVLVSSLDCVVADNDGVVQAYRVAKRVRYRTNCARP